MDLHWVVEDKTKKDEPKRVALYVGCLHVPLVILTKRNKWWSGFSQLPDVNFTREYAPLEQMQEDIVAKVQQFFGLANTCRPAHDDLDEP